MTKALTYIEIDIPAFVTPDSISGLQLWLKADADVFSDAGTTPAADGATVRQWNDQSGNARHASQSIGAQRPTYRADVDGMPAIEFVRADETQLLAGANGDLDDQIFTVFAVYQNSVRTNEYTAVLNKGDGASTANSVWELLATTNDPEYWTIKFDTSYGSTRNSDTQFMSSTETELLTLKRISNSSKEFYRNGVLGKTGSDSGNALNSGTTPLGIGSDGGNGFHLPMNGYIREILYYDSALSDTDRTNVEKYLRGKWGQPARQHVLTAAAQGPFINNDMAVYESVDGGTIWKAPIGATNPVFLFPSFGGVGSSSDTQTCSIVFFQNKYWVAYEVDDFLPNQTGFSIASATNLAGPWSWVTDVTLWPSPSPVTTTWNPHFFFDDDASLHIICNGQNGVADNTAHQPYIFDALNDTLTSWSSPTLVGGTYSSNIIDTFLMTPSQSPNGLYNIWYKQEDNDLIGYMSSASLKTGYTVTKAPAIDVLQWGQAENPILILVRPGVWRAYGTGIGLYKMLASESYDDWATWTKTGVPSWPAGEGNFASIITVASPPLTMDVGTFRFAIDTGYLPSDIDAIPSITGVKITPAIVSLGGNLGQRASVDVSFKDHKHAFASESYDSGTFWGKFRARYGLKLRGYPLRVIQGTLGQTLEAMETRHYIIESTDGPTAKGEYKIIAKDVLKLADGDRAQAPTLSGGFLVANITNVATTLTLSPAGAGNLYYDASGYVAIGGKEIVSFTRAGDVLTITRAQYNTVAVAHNAGDRVQACLEYLAQDVADIVHDLLVTYAGVNPDFITLANWQTETGIYLSTLYSALIAEPTAVNDLISELIEQASLVMWWDDISQQIRLQVLREVSTVADTYNANNILAETLDVREQPDKRISQVYTYFAKINPLVKEDQIDNYASSVFSTDADAELAYGSASIKKIFSRWIPAGGRAVAESVNDILLARFVTPPRRISFDVMRYSGNAPALGLGYQIEGWPFQDITGAADVVPAQIVRLNPRADIFEIEAEEVFAGATVPGGSPNDHVILIDANTLNVNLRTMHDNLYAEAVSGVTVNCAILAGIIVGSSSTANPAFDVGSWAAGVTINLTVLGRIEGTGGAGGVGALGGVNAGGPGGAALYTRYAISLTDTAGGIWGGGGGGGSGGTGHGMPGTGGGGAGQLPGNAATTTTGGLYTAGAGDTGRGGMGGDPGLPGNAGVSGAFSGPGAGGAAGAAIDGVSFVTTTGTGSPDIRDRRGGQIN